MAMSTGRKVATGVVVLVVVLAVLWAIPAQQGFKHRARIGEAMQDGFRQEIKDAIVARRLDPKAAPGRTEYAPATPYVKAINVDYRSGTIYVVLNDQEIGHPTAVKRNGWISLTATVENGKVSGWKCDALGVEAKLLPASCR